MATTYDALTDEVAQPTAEGATSRRGQIGLIVGPLAFVAMLVAPLNLTAQQQTLAAILSLVVIFWLTEAIPVPATALVGLTLCALLGVAPVSDVLAGFGTSTIFLFIGSFILARAMSIHGLDRRFALRVLSIRGVAESTYGTLIAFGIVGVAMSAFMSNTATTAMLLPIGLGIINVFTRLIHDDDPAHDPGTTNLAAALMLMCAYSASVGGLLTPIATPPNLLGRGFLEDQAGVSLPFLRWMTISIPIVIVGMAAVVILLIVLNRPEVRRIPGATAYCVGQRKALGPWTAGQRNTLIAFLVAVVLWLAPGVVAIVAGETSPIYESVRSRLDEGIVALAAASLLFVLPTDRRAHSFTLGWRQAVNIDWGTIILFGAGIALGSLLSVTGLAALIGTGLASSLGNAAPLTLTFIAVVSAILVSETTSNTASVGIVVPVVISVAVAMGIDPAVPGLAAVFGTSFGFMLPVSTPPNAIVYGSGRVPITRMVKSGIGLDLVGAVLITMGVTFMAGIVGLR